MACCSPSTLSGLSPADVSVGGQQVLTADKGVGREAGSDTAVCGAAAGSDRDAG